MRSLNKNRVNRLGKKIGIWEEYHFNGDIRSKGSYVNGLMDGYWEYYYSSGNLWKKGSYKDGLFDGTWEFYYPNGELDFKYDY